MLSAYTVQGKVDDAKLLFDSIPYRSLFIWNSMLSAYAQNCHPDNAKYHFDAVPEWDIVAWTSLLYSRNYQGNVEEAKVLFEKMPERDLIAWNATLSGHSQHRHLEDSKCLFDLMPSHNIVSYNTRMAAYSQHGYIEDALLVFQKMRHRNSISWNTLLVSYAQNGHTTTGKAFFSTLPEQNLVSWNVVIGMYALNGQTAQSLELFRNCVADGVKLDDVSFTSALIALRRPRNQPAAYFSSDHVESDPKLFVYLAESPILVAEGGSVTFSITSKVGFALVRHQTLAPLSRSLRREPDGFQTHEAPRFHQQRSGTSQLLAAASCAPRQPTLPLPSSGLAIARITNHCIPEPRQTE
ncbi:pentatricopeptide repeat-containing protein At2g35030, mitochondrial-like [Selaginella moellendorffii]|uniref:pentatricopeptide repeat-containing protein At2g35030, mitochondrial-like n=1 Tax=Selaginella moellendorffii TaxID=88036 RepID=UPI000D1C502D|nr:pentatricopeptide repeat-containing protein At2g35030, mitochondrial-like [Selaginella moellendorffii]|eukprot:XP_024539945.1 pentatricopeptide repeat-containing protein At2g35030, mitochondrial-like [Selaginella moellendorffii]